MTNLLNNIVKDSGNTRELQQNHRITCTAYGVFLYVGSRNVYIIVVAMSRDCCQVTFRFDYVNV